MSLSKSKYCSAYQCYKKLWLETNKKEMMEDVSNKSVLDNGTEVGELARGILGEYIDIEFNEDLNVMIQDTNNALKKESCVITEASFNYQNNFCSVDLLKKSKTSYEIYEVKSSTEIKDIYLEDVSYQYYVLTSLGLNVVKCNIVYINNKYVRKNKLELDKIFIIEDVSDVVRSRFIEVKNNIENINKYMKQTTEPNKDIDTYCFKPYDCPFFKYCSKNLEKNNVFDIRGMSKKEMFEWYKKGIYSFNDLKNKDIKDKFRQQIDFELNNKEPFIDKDKIRDFMNELTYPLYFLDFETYQQSIPQFDDVKPYEQIPFQYSLHFINSKNGKLEHKEFLSIPDVDPRRTLAEQLVKDIPEDACVLAYNMKFEKMVIKRLSELYKDLGKHLMSIHDNIKDLMVPFANRYYYTKEMEGSFSIKHVLPALFPNEPTLNYENLDLIHNGTEAMNSFASLGKLSEEEQLNLRKNLLKYCELDTYAMVKIWEKLKEI